MNRTEILIITCLAVVFAGFLSSPIIPTSIKNTIVMRAHAQTQTTTNATSYLTYKDSQGRFTISYPSGWTVTPAKNRFEPFAVKFTGPDLLSSLTIRFMKIDNSGDDIETIMSGTPDRIRFTTPNFELIQDVECKKYTIDGHKTCSMINTQTPDYISNIKIAMDVSTIINGTTYLLVYGSTPDNFDTNLPIIDKMIGSFKIPVDALQQHTKVFYFILFIFLACI